MVHGQVFLKEGVVTFAIYFFQDLLFLHLEIIFLSAKLCYAFEGKYFFCQHNFMKKLIAVVQIEPVCMCKEGSCVALGQDGGSLRDIQNCKQSFSLKFRDCFSDMINIRCIEM